MKSLPKKFVKSTEGQILIIFLLILVVAGAIVLSVATRTVTDIRTTTTSDESNRAYFAAEAGIEEALRGLESGAAVSTASLRFPNVSSQASVTVASSGGTDVFVYPNDIGKDEIAQLALLPDFTKDPWDSANKDGFAGDLIFYWGSAPIDSSHPGLTPAIEISVVYYCSSSCPGYPAGQKWGISKVAFDPLSSRGNGFCSRGVEPLDSPGESFEGKTFFFKAGVNLFGGSESCGDYTHGTYSELKLVDASTTKPVLARIRLFYNQSPLAVRVESEDGVQLPAQGYLIESTGQTDSGVTRKLEVTRLYPALPGLFDYVLFSGSSLSK